MIKAIVFDFFGVLASDGWLPYRDRHFGHDKKLLEKAIGFQKRIDGGSKEFSYDNFLHQVADLAGVSYEETRDEIDNNVPEDRVFEYIREKLKDKYKIGMLSNAGDDWLDEIITRDQIALFDAIALSFRINAIKPNPEAYQYICNELDVEPEECVFVDDQAGYCKGAREYGMNVIQYLNFKQFKTDIDKYLT